MSNEKIEQYLKRHHCHDYFNAYGESVQDDHYFLYREEIDELIKLIKNDEREECAKVAENTYDRQIVWYPKGHYIDPNNLGDINKAVAEGCAEAIRARGEQEEPR